MGGWVGGLTYPCKDEDAGGDTVIQASAIVSEDAIPFLPGHAGDDLHAGQDGQFPWERWVGGWVGGLER